MTADEIRKEFSVASFQNIVEMQPQAAMFTVALSALVLMGEIAAQLAELNEQVAELVGTDAGYGTKYIRSKDIGPRR